MTSTLPAGCNPDCPGCHHRRLTPAASARQKMDWLNQSLNPWQSSLYAIRQTPENRRLGYRDKVSLHARWEGSQWEFGMLRRDQLIAIPNCPVHSRRVNGVLNNLARRLPASEHFPLAYVSISGAQATLILKTSAEPDRRWLNNEMDRALSATGLEGLWLNLHPSAGRRPYSKRGWRLLWGKPRSRDAHDNQYGPAAFQQLIPDLYEQSLRRAVDFLQPSAHSAVIDLYCGIGISLRRWNAAGAASIGVELGGDALECARVNAPDSALLRGACAQRLPQINQWLAERGAARRLMYVNPPRTGLEPEVREWIGTTARPTRMAYLSCSSGTLNRDLTELVDAGYRVTGIQPYDFFPLTHHIETLTLLSRQDV